MKIFRTIFLFFLIVFSKKVWYDGIINIRIYRNPI
jgi:hypothetical protein